jgi:hypothetical protein
MLLEYAASLLPYIEAFAAPKCQTPVILITKRLKQMNSKDLRPQCRRRKKPRWKSLLNLKCNTMHIQCTQVPKSLQTPSPWRVLAAMGLV